jgi:hypothetical protein
MTVLRVAYQRRGTAGLGPMVTDGYPGFDPGGQLGQGAHVHAEPFPPRGRRSAAGLTIG